MPIYQYISEHPDDPEKSCRICRRGFELRRAVDREPLTRCLYCKNPVRKKISKVNVPKLMSPLSVSDAKKAGFTVLHKVSSGEYEKM